MIADSSASRGPISTRQPSIPRGWYATCVAYLAMPPSLQRRIAPKTRATYCRIRVLPRAWGEALDLRGAPLGVVRWVAWGHDRGERERRFQEAVASWDERREWPRGARGKRSSEGEGV